MKSVWVNLKLGKMRKADRCVVYPAQAHEPLRKFQGDRLVGVVDLNTGKAVINYRTGSSYPRFTHLTDHPSVERVELSPYDVQAIKDATPRSGDQVGEGVYIA